MVYWVIYDISNNKVRCRVSDLCKDYGLERFQKSAFLGNLSRNKAEMLVLEIEKYLNENDKVFVLPAGKEDFAKRIIFGEFDDSIVEKRNLIFIE